MTKAFWYWLILVIWAAYHGVFGYKQYRNSGGVLFIVYGGGLLVFILFVLIGLTIFPEGPFGTLIK
jgi:hypothetical protein